MSRDKHAETTKPSALATSRRDFIKTAVAVGGAAVAAGTLVAPNVARAQAITWRFQSTWPTKDIFHEFAQDYVKRVNEMAGGRLKLELLPAGAVVPAFQMQDAVHTGALDGGHGVTAYWYGKNKAFSLFGTGAPVFRDANMLLGWFYHGGGEALYNELVQGILKLNVVGFVTGPMPTQPLGWFKKQIKGPADLKNMKYRTVGLSADLFKELGAAVTILPGGEIVPAIDRGLIDGAEFNNPSSDRLLGFPDVSKTFMMQSFHQFNECFEIIFNRQKYETLPAELRAILRYSTEAASADMSWKLQDRYSKDLEEMKSKQGVKTYRTPRNLLDAQLKAWDKLIGLLSKDPFFKKVVDSQKAFGRRAGSYFLENEAPHEVAFNHFYKRKA
ncbi:MAG: TRAP transporter substrate-binding protein [Candidatus Lambdaproteobacteria bacterium]|nr:TRAP transporter substrate-binding protein [Candidatus Lambdaproteobacteria bacterium]